MVNGVWRTQPGSDEISPEDTSKLKISRIPTVVEEIDDQFSVESIVLEKSKKN
jgi:hypothetical protein